MRHNSPPLHTNKRQFPKVPAIRYPQQHALQGSVKDVTVDNTTCPGRLSSLTPFRKPSRRGWCGQRIAGTCTNCRNVHELPGLPSHPKAPLPAKTMARPTLSKHTSRTHFMFHSQRNVTDGTQNHLWRACRATLVCHRLGKREVGKAERHKKRWPQRPPFIIIIPTVHREAN